MKFGLIATVLLLAAFLQVRRNMHGLVQWWRGIRAYKRKGRSTIRSGSLKILSNSFVDTETARVSLPSVAA